MDRRPGIETAAEVRDDAEIRAESHGTPSLPVLGRLFVSWVQESPPEKDARTSEWPDKSVNAATLCGRGSFRLANTQSWVNAIPMMTL